MTTASPSTQPTVHASTLIRRTPAEVFAAFVDPDVTTRFWFSRSSGRLEPGGSVRWEWEMYGVSSTVRVVGYVENESLALRWDGDDDLHTTFGFTAHELGTVVTVTETRPAATAEEAIAFVSDSTGGYTTALCAAKALLEHGIELNAVGDKFPDGWV